MRARLSSSTVLLISYHFYPANEIGARRMTALAQYLAERGVQVIVVSAFGHQDIQPGSEIRPGILAVPVKRPRRLLIDSLVWLKQGGAPPPVNPAAAAKAESPAYSVGIMSRLKAFARRMFFRAAYFIDENKRWAWRASKAAVNAGRAYGACAVVSSSPPNTVLLAGALTAKRLNIPHLADFRDPWTDSADTDPDQRTEYLMQRPLEKWVVHSAGCVTSAGATVAGRLAERYPRARHKIHVVRNGYDGEIRATSADTGGRLSMLFAGELYLGRDPFPLLDALERLLERADMDASRLRVTFMGRTESYGGVLLSAWLTGKHCGRVVRLLPHLPASAVADEVSQATVLLNLAQQQPFSVPAKTFEHLISGREILLVCENDSETAQVVQGIRGVNQVDWRDRSALERTLLDLYRRHVIEGRMTVAAAEEVRRFSREASNERFWCLIDEIAGLSAALPRKANPHITAS